MSTDKEIPLQILDDEALKALAARRGWPFHEAPARALRAGLLPERYARNVTALTMEEQIRLCESRVLIVGCGGLGGVLATTLARAGVGFLRLVDGDVFAASNLNRQWLADSESLGRPKAVVARERVAAINPFVETEAAAAFVDEANALDLVAGTDLILDALDNLAGRFVLAGAARSLGRPFIHAGVAGWWGQLTTLLPTASTGLEAIYGARRSRDPAEEALGVLGAAAAIMGSLQAMEAIRLLTGRPPAHAGTLLYFDGESGSFQTMPLA